jgi:hypothetical protein
MGFVEDSRKLIRSRLQLNPEFVNVLLKDWVLVEKSCSALNAVDNS